MKTIHQYQSVISSCREIYINKIKDYGTSWRVLRSISIVDQVYIKAWRIRQIQETNHQKIEDSIESEFMAIVNYGIIALIQLKLEDEVSHELTIEEAIQQYDLQVQIIKELMLKKNHDYGEAWRSLDQKTFVDIILTKLQRIKQILNNNGQTIISEGVDANFMDIINYGIFALIKIEYDS